MIISGERRISYSEIHQRIAQAANGFKALGLRDGAPVGLMLRNDFAFFEASAAAAREKSHKALCSPQPRLSHLLHLH